MYTESNIRSLAGMVIRQALRQFGMEDLPLEICIKIELDKHTRRDLMIEVYGIMDDLDYSSWQLSGRLEHYINFGDLL